MAPAAMSEEAMNIFCNPAGQMNSKGRGNPDM
jgi:hypothetical protein